MLLDWPTVFPELAPKGPRFVEIIEVMVWPDIPFYKSHLKIVYLAHFLTNFKNLNLKI